LLGRDRIRGALDAGAIDALSYGLEGGEQRVAGVLGRLLHLRRRRGLCCVGLDEGPSEIELTTEAGELLQPSLASAARRRL
jgi:hypothetical protein